MSMLVDMTGDGVKKHAIEIENRIKIGTNKQRLKSKNYAI